MSEITDLADYKERSGKTKEQIAYEIGCSVFSVHNWLTGNPCSKVYQKVIRQYLQEMARKEAQNALPKV